MNGAESLLRTAAAAGIEVCFANPGTTEMPLVAALDALDKAAPRRRSIRAVLGLFEGVCTGAADGYGRMADRPAMTLLHLGPGFANGIANLHNARRAHSPVVNVIGNHATWHLPFDAPLTSDIVSLARPVSAWLRSTRQAAEMGRDMAEAIAAAGRAPGRVATLIVPSDCQWDSAGGAVAEPRPIAAPEPVAATAVSAAARLLRRRAPSALFIGGRALRERELHAAARVAAASGCKLVVETFSPRLEYGAGLPALQRLPYFPEQAIETLSEFQSIVIAGAREPIAFFASPRTPSRLIPEGRAVATLAEPLQDVCTALEALAEELKAPKVGADRAAAARPPQPSGALHPASIAAAIAALLPEGAILMEEALTTGMAFLATAAAIPRFTYLGHTGGGIGQGLPVATGAALACPDRKVVAFQADGSAMYTIQALWTQAREQLDVTTLICNNHGYRILKAELARAGVAEPGPKATALTDLDRPDIDFAAVARSLGVPGVRVTSADELVRELQRALPERGPNLIEMVM